MEPTKEYNLRKNPRPTLRKLESFTLEDETSSASTETATLDQPRPLDQSSSTTDNLYLEDVEGTGSETDVLPIQRTEGTIWSIATATTQPTTTTSQTSVTIPQAANTETVIQLPTQLWHFLAKLDAKLDHTQHQLESSIKQQFADNQKQMLQLENNLKTTQQEQFEDNQKQMYQLENNLKTTQQEQFEDNKKQMHQLENNLKTTQQQQFEDNKKQMNKKFDAFQDKLDQNQNKTELAIQSYQEQFTTHINDIHSRIDDIHTKVTLVTNTVNDITSQMETQIDSKLESHNKDVIIKLTENHKKCQNMVENHNQNLLKHFEETNNHMTHMVKEIKETTDQNVINVNTLKQQVNELDKRRITGNPNIYVTCHNSKTAELLPKFNGRNKNPIEFLDSLKTYLNHPSRRESSSSDYEEILDCCLEEHASKWWNLMKHDIEDFSQFEAVFIEKYWNPDIQRGIRRRLELEKYRPHGNLTRTEYFVERVIIYRNMTPAISEEEIVTLLSEHYSDLIQDACRVQNVTTIRGMERLLTRADLEDKNNKLKNQTPLFKTNRPNHTNTQPYPRPAHETRRPFNNTPLPNSNHRYSPYHPYHQSRSEPNMIKQQGSYNQCPRTQYNNNNNVHSAHGNPNNYYPNQNRIYPTRPSSPRTEGRTYYNRNYPTDEQRNVCQMFAKPCSDQDEKSTAEKISEDPHLNK